MVARLVERLSFRQARNTVILAILLGLFATAAEFVFEVRKERAVITDTVQQIVRIVQEPAAKATYDLDAALAAKVLDGLFSYKPIYKASVFNEFGRLAGQERTPVQHPLRWVSEWLFGGNIEVAVPLSYMQSGRSELQVGEVRVSADIHLAAASFLGRAGATAVNGLIRNLLLGLVLTAMFHVMVTKPILTVSRDMQRVTPNDPSARKVRYPDGHRTDEIGFLVGRINELLDAFGTTLEQRDRFAADLIAARKRAEEASQAKSQFLATVSHELRTPLNAIIGFSELIKIDGDAEGKRAASYADFAGEILDSGNQLLAIIGAILDLAEIDTGWQKLVREQVDVHALLEGSVEALDAVIRERGIGLRTRIEPDLPLVRADGQALRQVIADLMSNAVKFTSPGGIVEIGAKERDGAVAITVADTGIGIAPEHLS